MIFGPYTLDINRHIPLEVPLSQNDAGNSLLFMLFNGADPYELSGSVLLNGRKPSGMVFSYAGTWSGNAATFSIDEQMTAEAGQVVCEVVHMSTGGDRKGSANFILDVERDPMEDGVESETDLSLMQQAIAAAGQVTAIQGQVDANTAAIATKASQADLSALGDKSFQMRGILPSGDLNDATEFGSYQLSTSNTYTNAPEDVTSGMLHVFRRDSAGYVTQVFVNATRVYARLYTTSWGSWMPIFQNAAATVTAGKITTGWTAWRRGVTGIISFNSTLLAAGTYTNTDVLLTVSPPPAGTVRALLDLGGSPTVCKITNDGKVTFNNSVTLSAQKYLLGEIVYPIVTSV